MARIERLDGDRTFVLHGFLTNDECSAFIDKSERAGFEEATIIGLEGVVLNKRYDPGQKFAPHFDGYFRRRNGEQRQLTFMVYLNQAFDGGETRFYIDDGDLRITVHPERGMALAVEHAQLHEGAPVMAGRKYVLRTDVMYAQASQAQNARSTGSKHLWL